jgi:hypothetical protein
VAGLPANSIGFIGGGSNTLQSYISLATGNAYFAGNVGFGITSPTLKFHMVTSGSTYTTPETNDCSTIYVYNSNSSSTSAHSILALRTNLGTGGNPFVSWDINGVTGYSMGIDNGDADKLKIAATWSNVASSTILTFTTSGAATFASSVTASSFIKTGGTSTQFLKADGSVDGNTYLTTSAASSTYVAKSGDTMTGTLNFSNNVGTCLFGTMADNDQWRIRAGNTGTNAGFLEIATADDGTEPIYVRQYTGVFGSLTRTATLLDGSGNTTFPGSISSASISTGSIGGTSANFSSSVTASAFFESSDATIKTLITDDYTVEGIENIASKLYIKDGRQEVGYFAQDVLPLLPNAVAKNDAGILSLSYKEVHTAKIASLEKRVKELESKLGI